MTTRILGNFLSPAFKGLCLLASTLLVASCGGGGGGGGTTVGGGGIGGTGSVASVGVVSAVASVTVNGVTYSCKGATVTVDDNITAPSGSDDSCVTSQNNGQLRPGMVVVVTGSKDANGVLTASTVKAQSNVIGPAVNISITGQTFSVLSQSIDVDDNTRFELSGKFTGVRGLTALAALPANTVVQVSGLPNNQGRILATFVEIKSAIPNGPFEVRGMVSNSTASGFTIGNLNVVLNNQTQPADGQCVEAKGTLSGGTLILATLKNDDDCSGSVSGSFEQAQVEGIVSGVTVTPPTGFTVASQSVTIDGSTQFFGGTAVDVLNGVKVEAEGSITNGVLLAKKLTIESNGVRIKNGLADAPASVNTFTILGITVKVVDATELNGITLGTIAAGTSLEVEGSKTGNTQMTATKIKPAGGGGGKTELRGPLDANPLSPNMTILGVPINAAGATFQDLAGNSISSTTFFATAIANDIVKAKGSENPNNAILATEVELED